MILNRTQVDIEILSLISFHQIFEQNPYSESNCWICKGCRYTYSVAEILDTFNVCWILLESFDYLIWCRKPHQFFNNAHIDLPCTAPIKFWSARILPFSSSFLLLSTYLLYFMCNWRYSMDNISAPQQNMTFSACNRATEPAIGNIRTRYAN